MIASLYCDAGLSASVDGKVNVEDLVAFVGVTGFGLMIWAAVYGLRRREQWDRGVTRGFWVRFVPGYVATFVAMVVDPEESAADMAAGYLVVTGVGLMVWGGVFAFTHRSRWSESTLHGFLARFGPGAIVFVVVVAAVASFGDSGSVGPVAQQPQAAPSSASVSSTPPPPVPATSAAASDKPAGVPPEAQKAVVTRIDAGDAMQLSVTGQGESLPQFAFADVQLLHIRALQPGQCLSGQSAEHLRQLTPVGSTVWVQRDQKLRDEPGRYLLYVWTRSGAFVNVDMVARGYAAVQFTPPNSLHWEEISSAGEQAMAVRAGSWGNCGASEPTSSAQPSPQPDPDPKPRPNPQPDPSPVYTPPPDDEDDDGGAVYYKNCSAAKKAGAAPLHRGDPGYRSGLDRDNDGTACES